jgi:hypothetical protein
MGQIVSSAAKPKRCNLNKLSQLGTPAAGEYILVSSDNSMNAAGQGNFDCYIEGDGQKAATALELHKVDEDVSNAVEELRKDVFGDGEVIYDGTIQTNTTSPGVNERINIVGYDGKTITVTLSIDTLHFTSIKLYCVSAYDSSHILSTTDILINGTPANVVVPTGTTGLWFYSGGADSEVHNGTLFIEIAATENGAINDITEDINDIQGVLSTMGETIDDIEQGLALKSENVILATKSNDEITIKKEQKGVVILYTFKPFGANMLWQLYGVSFYKDNELVYSNIAGSDSFSPYHVAALNNIDGDDAQGSLPRFTGGTHGYDGGSTGTPTASSVSCELFVDGKLIDTNGEYSGNNICLCVKNDIQGWNTKKINGSGRAIIEESITYKIINSDDNLLVSNQICALEDVNITLYYGLQIAFARGAVKYISDEKSEWNDGATSSSYVGDSLDAVLAKNAAIVQMMFVDSYGLGKFGYLSSDKPKAFLSAASNSKSYYNLINGKNCELNAGDTIYMKGGFFFDYYANQVIDVYTIPTDKFQGVFDVSAYRGKQVIVKFDWDSAVRSGNCTLYQASAIQSSGIVSNEGQITNGGVTNTFTIDDTATYLWVWGGVQSVPSESTIAMTLYLPSTKLY